MSVGRQGSLWVEYLPGSCRGLVACAWDSDLWSPVRIPPWAPTFSRDLIFYPLQTLKPRCFFRDLIYYPHRTLKQGCFSMRSHS